MLFNLKSFRIDLNIGRIANIHYFEFTKNFHTDTDTHAFYELVYVDKGSLLVHAENFNGELKQRQLVVHRPNEQHNLLCINDVAPNVIIIGFECDCPQLDILSNCATTLSVELQKQLAEIIRESRNVFMPPYDTPNLTDMKKHEVIPFGSDQLIKNLLEVFLIKLIRAVSAAETVSTVSNSFKCDKTIAQEVKEYLEQNYCEFQNLAELCLLFGTNKTSLCNSFKNETGYSIVEYKNKLKIDKAKQMIREGERNFTQIAAKLNFSSLHYFSKMFSSIVKMTPSEYINTIIAKFEI